MGEAITLTMVVTVDVCDKVDYIEERSDRIAQRWKTDGRRKGLIPKVFSNKVIPE